MSNHLSSFQQDLEQLRATLNQVTVDVEKKALEENKKQLRSGKYSNDSLIKPDYNEYYADYKGFLNSYKAPFGTPDLFLSGSFYKSFKVDVENTILDINHDGSVFYADGLVRRYSENIFGLSQKSKEVVSRQYLKDLFQMWKKILK